MKQNIVIGILLLILGGVIGWVSRPDHFRDEVKKSVTDTVHIYETVRYSRIQLATNTYVLDIPKVPRVPVLIPIEKVDTIIKENKVYISMEREYRYTEMSDVQIWHSGIDSTIDSLNVIKKNMVISKTETTTQSVTKCNTLALGAELQYNGTTYIPIYLEYSHLLHKNVEISAKVMYDFPSKKIGGGMGMKLQIGW